MAALTTLQALRAKRLELLGELQRHEAEVAALRAELAHLDGAITIFMRGTRDLADDLPSR